MRNLFIAGEIHRFLVLQDKSPTELRDMCRWLGIEHTGTKADLVRELTRSRLWKYPILTQAIPLATVVEGVFLPEAKYRIDEWRRIIAAGQENIREFIFRDKNKPYKARLKYARCSAETLRLILDNRWYIAKPSQQVLIGDLKLHPDRYEVSLIIKPCSISNHKWIMLHVKAA